MLAGRDETTAEWVRGEPLRVIIDPQTLSLDVPGLEGAFTGEHWRRMKMPPCPKCGTTIRVDRIDVSSVHDFVPVYVFGRWECPNECDPTR